MVQPVTGACTTASELRSVVSASSQSAASETFRGRDAMLALVTQAAFRTRKFL